MEPYQSENSKPRLAEPQYQATGDSCKIRELPASMQPREYVEKFGIENAPQDVLLALILRTGFKGVNVVDLARVLLRRYGSLQALAAAPMKELCGIPGIKKVKAQMLKAALALGHHLKAEEQAMRPRISRPEDVYALLGQRASALEKEIFWVLILDRKNKLKCEPIDVTSGILDASLVHPREVFREAIRNAAGNIVLAHNHPSGDPAPSAEDLRITQQLIDAGKVIDIKVLDHVILGHGQANHKNFCSLREAGLVSF
jgi:DNA repair protein RadC